MRLRPDSTDASGSSESTPFGSRAVIYGSSRSQDSPEVRRALDLASRVGVPASAVRIEDSPGGATKADLAILVDRTPEALRKARRKSRATWVLAPSRRPRERLLVATGAGQRSRRRAADGRAATLARNLGRQLELELHGFSAWRAPRFPTYLRGSERQEAAGSFRSLAWSRVQRLADEVALPADRWHVGEGLYEHALAEVLTDLDPYAVVLGGLGRRGLLRHFLGSRVERVVGSAPDHHIVVVN